jgi:UPF0271 protein
VHDPDQIARRCVLLARGEAITDVDGQPLTLTPASVCVHGDTPGAVDLARRARAALVEAGVTLSSFA